MDAGRFSIDSKNIMKNLNQYIQEKYLIDKDTNVKKIIDPKILKKIDPKDQKLFDKASHIIGMWLFEKDTFRNYGENNRLEFLRYIDNNLLELIDYYEGTFEEFMEKLDMHNHELANFIEKYNNELIAIATNMYHDLYDEISF